MSVKSVLYLCFWAFAALACAVVQNPIITFENDASAYALAGSGKAPTIYVDRSDWPGVLRAANDLALDFGRVTGINGTVVGTDGTINATTSGSVIIVGTIGNSSIIQNLVQQGHLDISQTKGQWEAFQTKLVAKPFQGVAQALVIAGSDKRGSIYGLYDISEQIGVSPWYFWADVAPTHRDSISVSNTTKIQASPSVKYRGFFLNDEQPALNNWVQANYPDGKYGPGFNHAFYSTVFELLLRLRANYLWPASWNSMFAIDDKLNQPTANFYGVVMGSSHTEPMMTSTKEQSLFLNGTWSWSTNEQNVLKFMQHGAERAKPYESLFSMGMRGLGDTASPTLNASSLQTIVQDQQQILSRVFDISNVSSIPQMWCLYKEVGGYFATGLKVPDDITLLWADDNWGNMERLPLANETSRSGGAGIYFHFDYVGTPRDYKWINTISLQKTWEQTQQAYARSARNIWILNVGDLKPLELPITHFFDLAYDTPSLSAPDSTSTWIRSWTAQSFGSNVADEAAQVIDTYSMLTARRKYELLDPTIYSISNYDEAETVLQQWSDLVTNATKVYNALDQSMQPSFFEMVLHPCLAGYTVHQIHISASRNNLYAEQSRTSTNAWAQQVLTSFGDDYAITQRYHTLLNGKWNHMMSQTHLGYDYWQQPMRNSVPPLAYTQQREMSLAGDLGITCEGDNGTVSGDDEYHTLSSDVLILPPMDPYGPRTRWIEVFQRGTTPVNFQVSSNSYVKVTPSSGTLATTSTNTDLRLLVSVDWSAAPKGSTMEVINITTTTPSGKYLTTTNPYGNYGPPSIMLPLNKTSIASKSFHGFVESDATVSIEAEHFSSNKSAPGASAQYAVIPGYGRTLSGVTLQPFMAPSQSADSKSPSLTYDFYTFTSGVSNANITVYLGQALNTNPERPLKYGIAVDGKSPQIVQPIPSTTLGTLPDMWTDMVSNAVATNTTMHDLSKTGQHTLNFWLLEPGLTVQKIVIDLGGVRESYLGPPESMRV